MASASRRDGSNRGRAAIDWEAAFLYYASLPAPERSYQAVAAAYEVSLRTVETHGRAGSWRQRLAGIETEAAAQAAQELTDTRVAQLADVQKLVEASFLSYAKQLRNGQIRLTAADLPRLVKLLQELWQPPGEQLDPARQLDRASSPPPPLLERKLQVVRALHEADALHALDALAQPQQADQTDDDDDPDLGAGPGPDHDREDDREHGHQEEREEDEDDGHAQP